MANLIGRSMTKCYAEKLIIINFGEMHARRLLSTNVELNEMDPKL